MSLGVVLEAVGRAIGGVLAVPLIAEPVQLELELVDPELFVEAVEHRGRSLPVLADVGEVAMERLPREPATSDVWRLRTGFTGVDQHRPVPTDRPGEERDGRAVPLGDAAYRHHEPAPDTIESRLVRVADHRGIADRGGLDALLAGERRPEEEPALLADLPNVREPLGHDRPVRGEGRLQADVAALEAGHHGGEHLLHVGLAQGEDPVGDAGTARVLVTRELLTGDEELGDDPTHVRTDPHARVGREHRALQDACHGDATMIASALWNVEISESVDSAPWFRFGPFAQSPS